jgi:thymidylate synthase (FAD)
MAQITILDYTTKSPLEMIGHMAGICYNSDVSNKEKNIKRGINCLKSQHGRTLEFPDVYMKLEGYSARVIREWYTHIGGSPTRLQASTRYINYEDLTCKIPKSIENDKDKRKIYTDEIDAIAESYKKLIDMGCPKEDVANLLPLGMTTTIVCKHNLRNLIDMSHQRMCTRAYVEYKALFSDLIDALIEYSNEWEYIVTDYFVPKCVYLNGCPEEHSCGYFDWLKER